MISDQIEATHESLLIVFKLCIAALSGESGNSDHPILANVTT